LDFGNFTSQGNTCLDYTLLKTASSSAYASLIGLCFLALLNSFLGESLTYGQQLSAIFLSFLGVLYVFKGHLSELDNYYKIIFFIIILFGTLPAATDQSVRSSIS
jgi:hypothetical protein